MKGTQTSFPASVYLPNLTPGTGFTLMGGVSSESGFSVSGVGDINGDGIDDLIIGAPSAGASYIVFGQSGIGSSGIMTLSSLDGSNGFVLNGMVGSDSGYSVSGAGDINGDGVDDLIVGAPLLDSHAGASYVVFGQPGIGSSGTMTLSSLDGSNGFVLNGMMGSYSGFSVSGAGDINGDEIDDLIIGALNVSNAGVSYVVFGKSGIGSFGNMTLSNLNGSNGFVLNGMTGSLGVYSISGAGDINGDGIDDLIIGAPSANSGEGMSYIVFGQSGIGSTGNMTLSSLNGNNGFVLNGMGSGGSGIVSGAGDINGDGIDDLIIGAPSANSGEGMSYIVFGQSGIGGITNMTLSNLNGSNGFVLKGMAGSASGSSVSGVGDINGDGIDDLIIGAPVINSGGGAGYVVFGQSGIGSSGIMTLSNLDGSNGFALNGTANSDSGSSVSGAGDINGDGVDDLIIGAPLVNSAAGASYLVFGNSGISLLINQLTLSKGQTLLLNSSHLSATYGRDSARDSSLFFTMSAIQHGYFSLSNNTYAPITGFSQQQIRNGQVQFSHDDGAYPPSYDVEIGYGLSTLVQPASITFIHQGAILTVNQLTINQGQTVTLFSNQLSASDLDNVKDNPTLLFSVSAVQHGYFQQVGNPGFPITGFTQSQLWAGTIQFVHDGSNSPSGYNVSVSDGYIASPHQASRIRFNLAPVWGNNTLVINQGQTLTLNSRFLSATDPDDPVSGLIFMISSVQHGQFELAASPGEAITSFIQAQVQNGTVQFVQDGSAYAPSDTITLSDGKMTIAPQASKIVFNAAPVLLNNQLTINQGQTVILSGNELSATDPDNSAPSLTFIVSSVLHGQFERISASGSAISSFTQAEVQSGTIQFVHDGGVTAPGYQVAVSDGKMAILPRPSVIAFDAAPVLTVNSLALSQGQTVLLSPVNLAATDPDNAAAGLTFYISDVQHGYFEKISNSGVGLSRFIQSEVQNGVIQFVTDGSASAPGYNVSVSDGIITTPAQSCGITFNIAPTLVNNSLTVNQGQPVILTSSDFSATDPDNNASSLVFAVSEVQYGHFESLTNRGVIMTSFTQGQIQTGQIQLIPDGSTHSPVYSVAVSDGKVSSPSQFSTVIFNLAPVWVNNALNIKQGQTITITPAQISATQAGSAVGSLLFTVSHVAGGRFELVSAPGVVLTQFTQSQIQAGLVQFTQDGTATVPGYSIAVGDGEMTLPPQSGMVTFDAMPILDKNSLTITQGQTLILTSEQLSASDREIASGDLIFTASDVSHGHFEDIGAPQVPITVFGQQRLASGALKFVSDGSSDAPAYQISVSDGSLSTSPAPAIVNFFPETGATPMGDNTIRNALIGAAISGAAGFVFLFLRMFIQRKTQQRFDKAAAETEGVDKQQADFQKNVIRPIAKRILERIKITGCMGYVSDQTMKDAISAISGLVHELERQGVAVNLSELSSIQQHRLLDTIARQTRRILVPQRPCCSPLRFFCPEVTPAQIEDNIAAIAEAVKLTLQREKIIPDSGEIKEEQKDMEISRIGVPSKLGPSPMDLEIELPSRSLASPRGHATVFDEAQRLLPLRVGELEKQGKQHAARLQALESRPLLIN
jgi:hypothetical protein